jgi:hypothetical protein
MGLHTTLQAQASTTLLRFKSVLSQDQNLHNLLLSEREGDHLR